MSRIAKLVVAGIALIGLSACSISSESFVEEISGYSVTRGRITQVEDLHATEMQHLTDGVAITLDRPGRISLVFDNDDSRVILADRGTILVYGYSNDYVLKAEDGSTSETLPATPGHDRD